MKKLLIIVLTPFQLERLMASLERDYGETQIWIITHQDMLEKVKSLSAHYENVQSIISYQSDTDIFDIKSSNDLENKIRKVSFDQCFVAWKSNPKPIYFLEGQNYKDIKKLYPIIRFLYQNNLKEVSLYECGTQLNIEFDHIMDEFVDKHKGKRAFIAGNGPSLNKIDMSKLENEIAFGSNRCYLGFEKWGYSFPYWAITDRLQLEEHFSEWEKNIPDSTIKFFPFEYISLFHPKKNICPVNYHYGYDGHLENPKFDNDPKNQYLGFTVTHLLLQIAVIMGCNPIYLIGLDHNYNLTNEPSKNSQKPDNKLPFKKVFQKLIKKPPKQTPVKNDKESYLKNNIWTASNAKEQTHFDSRYNAPDQGRRFVIPRPERAEKAFENARIWAEENNIEIYNATPGTHLHIFEKTNFENLF